MRQCGFFRNLNRHMEVSNIMGKSREAEYEYFGS